MSDTQKSAGKTYKPIKKQGAGLIDKMASLFAHTRIETVITGTAVEVNKPKTKAASVSQPAQASKVDKDQKNPVRDEYELFGHPPVIQRSLSLTAAMAKKQSQPEARVNPRTYQETNIDNNTDKHSNWSSEVCYF